MNLNLAQLAECCAGHLIGDETLELSGVKNLDTADNKALSLYSDKRYRKQLMDTQAGAILTTKALADDVQGNKILVDNPLLALSQVLQAYAAEKTPIKARIAKSARISSSAIIGEQVHIGAHAVIGDQVQLADGVRIGPGCVLEHDVSIGECTKLDANITVYHSCVLGARCHISAGVVIGADGFGFAENKHTKARQWVAIPQIGKVVLGNDVRVGANTAIDRGSLDDTQIADGVIIDNLVQIAHNVKIDQHTAIAGCAAIAGSTHIGKNCKIGGRASIVGHLQICDDVVIFADSLVTKSIQNAGIYSSALPAMPLKTWHKLLARFRLHTKRAKG